MEGGGGGGGMGMGPVEEIGGDEEGRGCRGKDVGREKERRREGKGRGRV